MPMFSNIRLDVSHVSMVGMNHLLLFFTKLRLTGYMFCKCSNSIQLMANDDLVYDYCFSCVSSKRRTSSMVQVLSLDLVTSMFP
jgi:hypothetical protein